MKEKLQTKFATRQYMISDTFELYYYSTDDVPGVKEHTHTHYEFYLFLEGAISLEIDGVLYTPTPGDLLLIPPGVPHHLVMHDLVCAVPPLCVLGQHLFCRAALRPFRRLRLPDGIRCRKSEISVPARFRRVQHDPVPHHPPDRRNAVRSFWKRDADFSLRQRPADADQPNGV